MSDLAYTAVPVPLWSNLRVGCTRCSQCLYIVVLPFCQKRLKAEKSRRYGYPAEFKTIGDHIRAVRLDRELLQREAAEIIGCDVGSVLNWEKKGTEPALKHMPGIIEFLDYCPYFGPLDFTQKVTTWRKYCGITRDQLARILGVDSSSIWKLESQQRMSTNFRAEIAGKIRRLMNSELSA